MTSETPTPTVSYLFLRSNFQNAFDIWPLDNISTRAWTWFSHLASLFPSKWGTENRYFNGTWSFKNKKSKVQTSQIPSNLSNNPEHHRLKRCWFWSCWAYDLVRRVWFFSAEGSPLTLIGTSRFIPLIRFDMFIKQQYSYIIRIYIIYIHTSYESYVIHTWLHDILLLYYRSQWLPCLCWVHVE